MFSYAKKLFGTSTVSASAGSEYVASVTRFAGNYAPSCYLPCSGQMLQVSQYQQLFSVIGTGYGGDGRATFALPDLRTIDHNGVRVPYEGSGQPMYIICTNGMNPPRD